jgi:hypothetical protein
MMTEQNQPPKKRKCTMCGKVEVPSLGDICPACKDKVRREALGEQAHDRVDSDREFKKHGVTPPLAPEPREGTKK